MGWSPILLLRSTAFDAGFLPLAAGSLAAVFASSPWSASCSNRVATCQTGLNSIGEGPRRGFCQDVCQGPIGQTGPSFGMLTGRPKLSASLPSGSMSAASSHNGTPWAFASLASL